MHVPMIGKCHCGAVVFRVAQTPRKAVRCNCSYCARRGWYTGYAETDQFHVLQGQDQLSTYRFGRGQSENFFCRTCGIHTHFFSVYAGTARYGYNISCCDDIDVSALEVEWLDGKSF